MLHQGGPTDPLRNLVIHLTSRALIATKGSSFSIQSALSQTFAAVSESAGAAGERERERASVQQPSVPGNQDASLAQVWKRYVSRTTGKPFWYHKYTKEKRWSDPALDANYLLKMAANKQAQAQAHKQGLQQQAQQAAGRSTVALQDLAPGWVQRLSKRKGSVYYQNLATGETAWVPPGAADAHGREQAWALPRNPQAAANAGAAAPNSEPVRTLKSLYASTAAESSVHDHASLQFARKQGVSTCTFKPIPNRLPCKSEAEIVEDVRGVVVHIAKSHPLHSGCAHRFGAGLGCASVCKHAHETYAYAYMQAFTC
jgi:hypothetical protein